jgi:uncharacterized membrane protein YccF (DUF307 family)
MRAEGEAMLELLLRFVWFILIGWWLGQIAIAVAWFFNATIIGLPIGLFIINRLPMIITLRPPSVDWNLVGDVYRAVPKPQLPLLVRAVYFLLVGWWFSLLWLEAAYLLILPIVTIPVSFFMFSKSAAVTTLRVN